MLIAIAILVWAVRPILQPLSFAHAPDWLVSKTRPETLLIGINVADDSLADVMKRFGKPSKVEQDPQYPNERSYTWDKRDLTIRVSTMFHDGTSRPTGEHVYSVFVRGNASIPAARTGASIHLGDSFGKLIARYGSRYQTGHREDMGDGLTVLFVFSNDTELAATLNENGRITALQLTVSEE
jgi:hypothetical protein